MIALPIFDIDDEVMNPMRIGKLGFIGAGNMASAMIKAFVESGHVPAERIYVSNRSSQKLNRLKEVYGIQACANNEEVVDQADLIILAIKPQDLVGAIEPIGSSFLPSHTVISLAAGFNLRTLQRLIPQVKNLVRVMPNTPTNIRRGVIGYCLGPEAQGSAALIEQLMGALGIVVFAPEGEAFEALTVSCGSGPGFVFELMQYWQEWIEERGFEPAQARRMVVQTFLGAAELANMDAAVRLEELQDRVTSKKGVTAAGLQSMRELEIERALRYSFEKAVLRDQEIARGTAQS